MPTNPCLIRFFLLRVPFFCIPIIETSALGGALILKGAIKRFDLLQLKQQTANQRSILPTQNKS